MRVRTAGRTIPQTGFERSNWTRVGKNGGRAAEEHRGGHNQEGARHGAPGKGAERRGARRPPKVGG
jgi:hypothetical protein